jgi:ADP-ribosylglycohydrolase
MNKKNIILGAILGGAMGDALGYPIEFYDMEQILDYLNGEPVIDKILSDHETLLISDDTQMTLFTIEGLLRSNTRGTRKGICHGPSMIYASYLRWLLTQGRKSRYQISEERLLSGWLVKENDLYHQRAPGMTCISALYDGEMGTPDNKINTSKGCGGVMRVAPIGFLKDSEKSFTIAMEVAALTHTHPSGYIAAGAFSMLIHFLSEGNELMKSLELVLKRLQTEDEAEENINKIKEAITLSHNNEPHFENVKQIGEGWVAEEALGIAIYSSLVHPTNIKKALTVAIFHSGDSDSTGSMTGNIVGAMVGHDNLPDEILVKLELREVIEELCIDLYKVHENTDEWWEKYPGY